MLKAALLVGFVAVSGVAMAEETTVIKRESTPEVGVRVVPPVAVEHRSTTVTTGCDTKVIHKENDLGDSRTIKKTDC